MSSIVNKTPILVEDFLDKSLQDIIEMGQELFFHAHNPVQGKSLDFLCKKIGRIKEDSGRLNFKKIEEISYLLENMFHYVGIKKISIDEKFINICQRANNLCGDILQSVKLSGFEKSRNYKRIVGEMMKYLEFNVMGERPLQKDDEIFDISVDDLDNEVVDGLFLEKIDNVKCTVGIESISALIMESGNISFCIDQKYIISLDKLDGKSIEFMRNMEFYRYGKEALPIARLNKFFSLPEYNDHGCQIVIVEENEKCFGIIVDKILNSQEIFVKTLDAKFFGQDIYSGVAIIDEGDISLVLNLVQLYQMNFHGKNISCPKGASFRKSIANDYARDERQMLVVELVNEKRYGIPIKFVERIENFLKKSVEWSGEQAVVRCQEKVLPIVNFTMCDGNNDEEICCIVVVFDGIKRGLVVKNVFDVSAHLEEEAVEIVDLANWINGFHAGRNSDEVKVYAGV